MEKLLIAVAILLSACVLGGCNTSGCTENQNSLPLAGFYTIDSLGRQHQVSLDSLDVGGVGAPGDSLLYSTGMALTQAYLPLRSTTDETRFFFHYTQAELDTAALNDTITFGYSSSPYFASEECGAVYYYHIHSLRYTRHVIDSIALLDSLITNTDIERLKIFFRTSVTLP